MKIVKKEIKVAMALALTVIVLSIFYNTALQRDSFQEPWELKSTNIIATIKSLMSEPPERVRIMDADIQGKMRNGTFETVVPFIESLTREKDGFMVTEDLIFKDGLWGGEIVSKLPPTNASSFKIETRQKIDENGRILIIEISIREFTSNKNATDGEQYSTIKTFPIEEFEEEKETPGPVIQLISV